MREIGVEPAATVNARLPYVDHLGASTEEAHAAVADHPAISSVTVIELPANEQMPTWLQG